MFTQLYEDKMSLLSGYPEFQVFERIIYLEGSGNYTQIYGQNKPRAILVSHTLKRFEEQLPSFIRISKSALINPDYVSKVIKTDTRTACLVLANGVNLPISRRRMSDTLARLGITLQGIGIATVHRTHSGNFKVHKPIRTRGSLFKHSWGYQE